MKTISLLAGAALLAFASAPAVTQSASSPAPDNNFKCWDAAKNEVRNRLAEPQSAEHDWRRRQHEHQPERSLDPLPVVAPLPVVLAPLPYRARNAHALQP